MKKKLFPEAKKYEIEIFDTWKTDSTKFNFIYFWIHGFERQAARSDFNSTHDRFRWYHFFALVNSIFQIVDTKRNQAASKPATNNCTTTTSQPCCQSCFVRHVARYLKYRILLETDSCKTNGVTTVTANCGNGRPTKNNWNGIGNWLDSNWCRWEMMFVNWWLPDIRLIILSSIWRRLSGVSCWIRHFWQFSLKV